MVEVGEKVLYIPAECYATDRMPDGGFAYHFEIKTIHRGTQPVTDNKVNEILASGNREMIDALIPKSPKKAWTAEVLKVHEDGSTADLLVDYPLAGCKHGMAAVPCDPTAKKPGTWHKPKE